MRPGQNKRMRGRNRRGPNPLTRSFESNGPDVKIRGSAAHIAEKYVQLARDAHAGGDPVAAENYLQHAEHYLRIIAAAQAQNAAQNGFGREDDLDDDDFDSEVNDRFAFRAPQLANPQHQPQPYLNERGDNGAEGRAPGERFGQERSGQDRAGQDRTGQERSGQDRAGQDRTGHERSGQDRPERGGQERHSGERNERRFDRRDRGDRPERQDRNERHERGERGERFRDDQPRFEGAAPERAERNSFAPARHREPAEQPVIALPEPPVAAQIAAELPAFITGGVRPAEPAEAAAPAGEEGERGAFRTRRRRRPRTATAEEGGEPSEPAVSAGE